MKVERPGKKAFFKMNHNLPADVENWAVEPNSGNFQHSAYCRNQCPIEDRIYDFDIMNSRNSVEIRKEKKRKYTHFSEETAFQKFMFHLDCEQATITALLNNFPETPVTLCSVHIIRNLMKQLKTYTTGDFCLWSWSIAS